MRLRKTLRGHVDTIERVLRRRPGQPHKRSVFDSVAMSDHAAAVLTGGSGSHEVNVDDDVTLNDNTDPVHGAALGSSLYALLPASTGTVKYVATTGSDTTGDGTQGNPWATLQKLLNTLTSGQKGEMAAGIYEAPTGGRHTLPAGRSGTATDPIEVYAATPGTVQIRPGGATPKEALVISSGATASSYWRFRGLIFERAGAGSNYPNIYVAGTTAGPHHVEFWNCESRETLGGSGVFVEEGCHDIYFINCTSHDNTPRATSPQQSHGFYITGDRYMLLNCLAYNQDGMGFQIRTNDPDGPQNGIVANCLAFNCKGIISPNNEYAGFYGEGAADNNQYRNNISYDNRNGFRGVGSGTPSPHNIVAFNIANANDNTQYGRSGSSLALDYDKDGDGNYTGPGDNLTSDPLLVDPAGHDFHLQPGSPAEGYGDPDYCPPFDHDNQTRTQCDAGPYAS